MPRRSRAALLPIAVALTLLISPASWLAQTAATPSHPSGAGASGAASTAPAGVARAGTPPLPSPVGPIGGRLFDLRTGLPDGASNSVSGLAVDPSDGTVYAANEFAATVTVFNESTGVVQMARTVGSFVGGSFPAGLLLDPAHHRLFVSISTRYNSPSGAGWVLVLNESTLATESNLSFPGSPMPPFEPTYLAYDDPTDQLFVENATMGEVAVVDLATDTVRSYLACPVAMCAEHGYGLLDVPEFHTLVVPTCAPLLWLVNTSNDSTRALVPGRTNQTIMAWAAFDSADQALWVENYTYRGAAGSFLRYNLSTLALLSDVPGAPPRGTALSYDQPDNLLVTTNINGSFEIATYHATNGTLVASSGSATSVAHPFYLVALDPVQHRAIAGGPGNATTIAYRLPSLAVDRVFDSFPASQTAVAPDPTRSAYLIASTDPNMLRSESVADVSARWSVPLPVGANPVAVAISPDLSRAYVADAATGNLIAVSAQDGAPVGTYATGALPSGLCALISDPSRGLLYAGSADPAEVLAFNVTRGATVATLPLSGYAPCRLSLNPATHDLLVLSTTPTGRLFVVHTAPADLFVPAATWVLPPAPLDATADASGTAYVLVNSGTTLLRCTGPNGTVSGSLDLSASPASALAVDRTDGLLFLATTHTATILLVSVGSMSIVGSFDDAAIVGPIAYDDVAGNLVAPTGATGQVLVATVLPTPSSPTVLFVRSGNNSLSATWGPPTSNGSYPVTGYRITAQPIAGGPAVREDNTSALTDRIANLTNGVAYNVSVAARSAAGVGTQVATSTGTPAGVPYPPTHVTVSAVGVHSLTVNWTAPSVDGGAAISTYTIQVVSYPPGGPLRRSVDAGPNLSAAVTGLAGATSYSIEVSAVNAVGTGNASTGVTVTTLPPSGPSFLWWEIGGLVGVAALAAIVVLVRRRRSRRRADDAEPSVGSSDPTTRTC